MKILLISALACIFPPSFTGIYWNEGPPTPVTTVPSTVVLTPPPLIIDLTPTTTRLCENTKGH